MKIVAGARGVVSVPGQTLQSIQHINRDAVDATITKDGAQLDVLAKRPGLTSIEVTDTQGNFHLVLVGIEPAAGESATIPRTGTTAPPANSDGGTTGAVDAFETLLRRRLEQAAIKDDTKVDRATLIRRLYLDIVGIPPSPQEVKDFIADESDNAAERLVDRILSSPDNNQRAWRAWWEAVGRHPEVKVQTPVGVPTPR